MDIHNEVLLAEVRIRPHIRRTFLEYSPYLSKAGGANVYCKLENLQHTGSFKSRGALNKVLSLAAKDRARGIVTASTGNHGMAVAWSMNKVNTSGIVFVPECADPEKLEAIERLGAEVRRFGQDTVETEVHARQYAADNEMTYVPPYNDPLVAGGQGTIAVELAEQLDRVDAVFASVGGGGLVSGIAAHLKTLQPDVQIIGCSPDHSQVMLQSVKAGKILDLPSLPTLSDATSGGLETGSITFDLCRELVDAWDTVSEEEISESLRLFLKAHHMLIEGSAAVAVASFLKLHEQFAGKNVVLIICGANIGLDILKRILEG